MHLTFINVKCLHRFDRLKNKSVKIENSMSDNYIRLVTYVYLLLVGKMLWQNIFIYYKVTVFVRLPIRTVPIRNIFWRDEITMGNMFFSKICSTAWNYHFISFSTYILYNSILTYMRVFVTLRDCTIWSMALSTYHGVNLFWCQEHNL